MYINKPAFKEFPLAFMGLESIQQSKKFVNTTNFNQFHTAKEVAELRKVVKACGDAKLNLDARKAAYAVLFDKWEELQDWTVSQLLQFLRVENVTLASHIIRFLAKKYDKNPLKDGSELLILGKATKWKNQRALKARIIEEEVSCVSELTESTTHVLLGGQLEKTLEKSDSWENVTYLNQAQLKDFLESKEDLFLKDSSLSDQEIENIRLLLSNPSEENVQLALQLLRTGGIPKPIFTDLFAVHVVHQNKKIRKSIRKLLRPFMDENDLKALLSCGQYFYNINGLEHYLVNSSCFNAYEIMLWLFKERGIGSNFLLNKTTEEQAKAFIKMKLKKGRFLNFQECKDLKNLPDVLHCFPEIEKINLSKTGFIGVPKVLLKYDFPNLKKVDMRHSVISYLTIKVRKLERTQFEAKYPDCKLIL
ncbi:MAG: hypothetical protein GY810_16565 [Aureispira sp.]|nr:hypothetical protein [Aureispira sp.]